MNRRDLLRGMAVAAGSPLLLGRSSLGLAQADPWEEVRGQFEQDPRLIHLGALWLSSHPRPVREAIARHRRGLDREPVGYVLRNDRRLRVRATEAAARYWETRKEDVALTDSTTMGLAILYNGLRLGPKDEVVTTVHDYFSTLESLRLKSLRTGVSVRKLQLFEEAAQVSQEALAEGIVGAVGPRTRVVALTWVHSDTGLKLPLAEIAYGLSRVNRGRDERDRVLLCVDGVHGFGVEDASMKTLGCDFFVAGCHKWLYGPRGTGVIYAAGPALWQRTYPTIPAFRPKHTPGLLMTPGGFHSFEHRWALGEAFDFHLKLGKPVVAARLRALSEQVKEGLTAMPRAILRTPRSAELSAALVVFDLKGIPAPAVVRHLRGQGIVVTRAPYGTRSVRVSPTLGTTPEEIDRFLAAVRGLSGGGA